MASVTATVLLGLMTIIRSLILFAPSSVGAMQDFC